MSETISTAIEIDAAPERVWAVLTDLASYPEWHPVYRKVDGQALAGSRIRIESTHPRSGNSVSFKVTVLTAEPPSELTWRHSTAGLMFGVHSFVLSPIAGGTQLVQSETYRGLFSRFPPKTIGRIQANFEAINEAIKAQAESPG